MASSPMARWATPGTGRDSGDIVRGLDYLVENEAALKKNIARLHAEGGLDLFKREQIVETYRGIVQRAFG